MADYYGWNMGTPLQKSLEGLLRSLLHQVLRQHPSLLETAIKEFSEWKGRSNYIFPVPALRNAISSLATISTHRFCFFFVDGLDEMETGIRARLARLCTELALSGNIKLCVSSRPWVVFTHLFHDFPQLQVQDVTKEDIRHFAQTKLQGSQRFTTWKDVFPSEPSKILAEMVDRSGGSFLWVSVAVQALLTDLQEVYRFGELRRIIKEFPKDITSLYGYMLAGISPTHRADAAECLDLARAFNGPFPLDIVAALRLEPADSSAYAAQVG
jgi:hypothetical protein